MNLTITQFGVVDEVFLSAFTCRFGDSCNRFALFLGVLDLLEHDLHGLWVLMEIIVQLGLDEVVYELIDRDAAGRRHIFGTEFDFGLRLEDRLLYVDSDRSDYAVTDVCEFLVLIEKLFDGTSDRFAVSGLVRTALDGVLTIDERVILIAVLVGVRQGNLDVFAHDMNDRVERRDGHILRQEVEQTVLGGIFLAVIDERQTGVEVRVVAEQLLDVVIAEMVVLKESFAVVGHELDDRTASLGTVIIENTGVGSQFALCELCATRFAFAVGLHSEERREGIDGFGTDTVQTDGFLEGFGVVLTAGIEHGDYFYQFAQRNTASVVTHTYSSVPHIYFDHLTFTHTELIDGVIDGFFDEDVDTVIGVTTVT